MVASITVRLPPVDRPAAFTSGPRPGTPSPGPTTYPRVTGSLDTAASLDRFRRLSARYIASPCRRARIHPKLRHTTRRDYRKLLGRGHTTASITTDTYGHLIRSELEELAGRLEQALVQRCSPTARTSRGHPRRNRWSQARRKWDSNPPSCTPAPRGAGRWRPVTCDSCRPVATIRARGRPAVPDATRTQGGPRHQRPPGGRTRGPQPNPAPGCPSSVWRAYEAAEQREGGRGARSGK